MILTVMDMTIYKSAEDYLEAMLMLKEERGYIRSVDVAEKLGVTKPSVSYATKRLRESGYITTDPAGMIVLLEPGPGAENCGMHVRAPQAADRAAHRAGCQPGDREGRRLQDRTRPERGKLRRDPHACPELSLNRKANSASDLL